MAAQDRLPVIIGVGQFADTTSGSEEALSPLQMMTRVAQRAADDAGATGPILDRLDSITVIRSFSDTVPAFRSPFGRLENAPWSLARTIGAEPKEYIYPPQGGDTPQTMLARAARRIVEGEIEAGLVVGSEALRTERNAKRAGLSLDWSESAPFAPDELGGEYKLYSDAEIAHGMRSAVCMYALFEQALRHGKGLSLAERQEELGRLFAPFAKVAEANPYATRREGYSAADISTVSSSNRYVGFPYTRLMTANAFVDQAAAVIICSSAFADAAGVPADRRVYLHAAAHAHDEWLVTERAAFDRSPAIREIVRAVTGHAGIATADIADFDIYSCFASAVEVAANEIGIGLDDPRGLTATGGLPFFGGPGNNYVTHAIAEIVARARSKPGSFGLITANGGLLTKHAGGLYSTTPPQSVYFADGDALQKAVDRASGPKVEVVASAEGEATIETYTIVNGKEGPERGVIVGRLTGSGERFLANTPADRETLEKLMATDDAIGMRGTVTPEGPMNRFVPNF